MKANVITDEMLSELLSGLDDNIEVPEDVSAGWRNAIKHESRIIKIGRYTKSLSAFAAAIAVFVCATLLFRAGGILPKTETAKPVNVYSIASADSVMALAADGEDSDILYTANSAADDEQESAGRIISAECSFSAKDSEAAQTAVENAMSGYDAYFGSRTISEGVYAAEVRILAESIDAFAESLKTLTDDFAITIHETPEDEKVFDAQGRLDTAYETVARLKAELESADAEKALRLDEELNKLYSEIDELERTINSYGNDRNYARVSITAKIGGFGQRLKTAVSSFIRGFGSDLAVTVIMLLPVLAIIAAAVVVIKKKASK